MGDSESNTDSDTDHVNEEGDISSRLANLFYDQAGQDFESPVAPQWL